MQPDGPRLLDHTRISGVLHERGADLGGLSTIECVIFAMVACTNHSEPTFQDTPTSKGPFPSVPWEKP